MGFATSEELPNSQSFNHESFQELAFCFSGGGGRIYKLFLSCVVSLELFLPYNASLDGKYTAMYYPLQQNSVTDKAEIGNRLLHIN